MTLFSPVVPHASVTATPCTSRAASPCGVPTLRRAHHRRGNQWLAHAPVPRPRPITHSAVRELQDLPEAKGMPVFGMTFKLFTTVGILTELAEELGSPFVFNMGIFGGKQLVVDDKDTIAELLNSEGVTVQSSWPESVLAMTSGKHGSMRKHGKEYLAIKGRVAGVYSADAVRQEYLPRMAEYFTQRMDAMVEQREVMFAAEARKLAFSMAAWSLLGETISPADIEALVPRFNDFSKGVFQPAFNLPEGLPGSGYWKGMQARNHIVGETRPRMRHLMQEYLAGRRTSCAVHRILDACVADGLALDESLVDTLVDNAINLTFAGTDTSSISLMNVVTSLAQDPKTLEQLRREQDAVVERHGPQWSMEVLGECHYAKAVVAEILRLKFPVPMVYRKALTDVVVQGVRVPAGTMLQLSWAKVVRGDGVWNPDRWIQDGVFTPQADTAAFTAFGGGRRRCWGEQLARAEIALMVCLLARSYEWRIAPEDLAMNVTVLGHPTGLPLEMRRRSNVASTPSLVP